MLIITHTNYSQPYFPNLVLVCGLIISMAPNFYLKIPPSEKDQSLNFPSPPSFHPHLPPQPFFIFSRSPLPSPLHHKPAAKTRATAGGFCFYFYILVSRSGLIFCVYTLHWSTLFTPLVFSFLYHIFLDS